MADSARHKLLVTGGNGQLAAGITDEFARCAEIVSFDVDRLDITDASAVTRAIREYQPDLVVNCAAWNDVDAAEDHPLDALRVNSLGPAVLASACNKANVIFVHYSTDFVFDGDGGTPYTESDSPSPRNVYGMSKLVGEMLVSELPRTYVLRLESLFGGRRSRSTIDRILAALTRGDEVRVFADRVATPSYVPDVARATRCLIESGAPAGTYHVVNSGVATWHEIALEGVRILQVSGRITPIRSADVTLRAVRPRYCALSNSKLRAAGVQMPHWTDALRRHCENRTTDSSLR